MKKKNICVYVDYFFRAMNLNFIVDLELFVHWLYLIKKLILFFWYICWPLAPSILKLCFRSYYSGEVIAGIIMLNFFPMKFSKLLPFWIRKEAYSMAHMSRSKVANFKYLSLKLFSHLLKISRIFSFWKFL